MLGNQKGSSITEFVIVVPIFLLIVSAIFMIGSILYTKTLLISAVSRAVEHGSYIYNEDSSEADKITEIEESYFYVTNKSISSGISEVNARYEGDFIYVEGKFTIQVRIPLIRRFFEDNTIVLEEQTRKYITKED